MWYIVICGVLVVALVAGIWAGCAMDNYLQDNQELDQISFLSVLKKPLNAAFLLVVFYLLTFEDQFQSVWVSKQWG